MLNYNHSHMQLDIEHPKRELPRIAVDVMGSDGGPQQIVAGVRMALASEKHRIGKIFLVGDESIIVPLLQKNKLLGSSLIDVIHTDQFVEMNEKPIQTLKHKKDASMFRCVEFVREGKADAALSCGNTGSLMAGSTLKLRTIPGVARPALVSVIPTRTHRFVLIDVGANPYTTIQGLVHNAILGSHFAKAVINCSNPRVGLLTIGTEEGKGNELIQKAHDFLKDLSVDRLNYKGLIEGFDLFDGTVDVVVCDGFVGNILLKTCESLFLSLKDFLKEEFNRSCVRKLGAILANGVFKRMKSQFSPDKFSGAPLLGLKGWVFKSHGSSKAGAIKGALNVCLNCLEVCNFQDVEKDIFKANTLMSAAESKCNE